MKIFILVATIVLFVVSLAVKNRKVKRSLGILLAGFVLFTVVDAVAIVPTGYSGVRSTFGQVSEESVQNGANIKIPYIQTITLVNNKQRDVHLAPSQVWGETSEQVQVYAQDAVVSYRLLPEKSAYMYINFANISDPVDEGLFDSAYKRTTASLDSKSATNRAIVEPAVLKALQQLVDEKYGAETIEITQVVINQMDFEDSYNTAIAERNAAEQDRQKQEIQNEINKEKAEADAEVARTTAQGKADAEKIEAQGKAEANSILSNSVTDKTLQQDMLDKWNGALPNVVASDNGLASVFDVSSAMQDTQPAE